MLLRTCISLIIFATAALTTVAQVNDDAVQLWPLVSVCDVLASPQSYNGALLRLRGLGLESNEGSFLRAAADCPVVFKTGIYVWPNLVAITTPLDRSRIHTPSFQYETDSEQILLSKIKALQEKYPDKCLLITYAGLFETRTDWSKSRAEYPDGSSRYLGFGNQNLAPAQLLAKRAVDVEVDLPCIGQSK